MVVEWLLRKSDTKRVVSNFSSGGRVVVVVVVMGNEGVQDILYTLLDGGFLFTHYPPVGTSASHCSINRTLMGEHLDRNR